MSRKKEIIECVVVEGARLPTGKSSRAQMNKYGGYYRNVSSQDMLVTVLESVIDKVQAKSNEFDPTMIEDVAVGILSQIGDQGANLARIASIMAKNVPDIVAGQTVNRYCNAGLQAINTCANAIKVGDGDIMIAAGVENLTHYAMGIDFQLGTMHDCEAIYPHFSEERMGVLYERMSMVQGVSAEMVAEKYELTREDLDKFGLWSHQKATKAARDVENYKKKIIPMTVDIEDEEGNSKEETVTVDQTHREICLDDPNTAYTQFQNLRPVFKDDGIVTAGNSSQITDGAAAVMLMSRKKADELGLKPIASILSTAVAGDDPMLMLLGPIPAQERALERAGDMTMDEMGIIEPNEAFASPCLAFAKHFDYAFDDPRVNPTGGAIAVGHPIGASGVVYFVEMMHYMQQNNLKYGIETLCGGGGVGIATVISRPDLY